MNTEDLRAALLSWREIETPCLTCTGSGKRWYSSTSTWRGGMGGSSCTVDICDTCWGSGDANSPWLDLKKLRAEEAEKVSVAAGQLLAQSVGASLTVARPAVAAIAEELHRLSRGRKPRPPFFYDLCRSLVKTLRAMGKGKEP